MPDVQLPDQPHQEAGLGQHQSTERAYLQRVREECLYLDSEGVDQRRAELSEVFVMLEAVPSRRRESVVDVAPVPQRAEEMGLVGRLAEMFGLKESSRQDETPSSPPPPPPVPLSQALKEHAHLVVLGEPGTGKSTLLQFVALCFSSDGWARQRLNLDEARLPVRIPLKPYDGVERLDRFIVQQLDRAYVSAEKAQTWLVEGRLAILLDGLDEVQEGQRAAVLSALQRFAATPEGKNSRIVLSSRIAGYTGITDFGEYTIKPLTDPADAQANVVGWLHALKQIPREAAHSEAEALLTKMQQQPGLRRVLTNPLLLRLAVAVYVDTGQVALNRTELYRRYVEEVAWRRAQNREDCHWSWTQVTTALEIAAWTLQTNGPQTVKALGEVIETTNSGVKDRVGLMAFLHQSMGLLAVYGYDQGKLVSFRHLTFQEYFVAHRLQRAWIEDQRRAWRFLRPRLHHPAWREPILMMAGTLDEDKATKLVWRIWKMAHSPYERELHRDMLLAAAIDADDAMLEPKIRHELGESLTRLYLDVGFAAGYLRMLMFLSTASLALALLTLPAVVSPYPSLPEPLYWALILTSALLIPWERLFAEIRPLRNEN